MRVLIVGLGLIGASYAKGLKNAGFEVYGVDINEDTINYALENGFVDEASVDSTSFISKAQIIILGLYPNQIITFLKKYQTLFTKEQLITDVSGVKTNFIYEVSKYKGNASYLTHHPMAGREKMGIKYATPAIFKGANFLICPVDNSENDIDKLKLIAKSLDFGRISIISPEKHDKMIGFTSQLTHAIACSLVNSDTDSDTKNFIGDSYRDLTRIAMINEELWSELFMANRDYLLGEIQNFELELNKMKEAICTSDTKMLKSLFIKSCIKRSEMEK